MNKKHLIIIVISIFAGIGIVLGALIFTSSKDNNTETFKDTSTAQKVITKSELARANGKDGADCYVAVDNIVYLIEDFSLWSNGSHKSSDGQAYCGADMTKVIDQAPHGRSKLDLLVKVGTVQD